MKNIQYLLLKIIFVVCAHKIQAQTTKIFQELTGYSTYNDYLYSLQFPHHRIPNYFNRQKELKKYLSTYYKIRRPKKVLSTHRNHKFLAHLYFNGWTVEAIVYVHTDCYQVECENETQKQFFLSLIDICTVPQVDTSISPCYILEDFFALNLNLAKLKLSNQERIQYFYAIKQQTPPILEKFPHNCLGFFSVFFK